MLILSHGNVCVESGFSINEDMLLENMKERSLMAYRLVYGGVMNAVGISIVDITKEMIKDVDDAHKPLHQVFRGKQTVSNCWRET